MAEPRLPALRTWWYFAVIGGMGFLTEAAILHVLVKTGLVGPYAARCVSFPVAVTLTWALNRRITFSARVAGRTGRRYVLYLVGQFIGALLNLATYAAAIYLVPLMADRPISALAIGAGVGFLFNFWWADQLVFTGRPNEGEQQ